MSTHTTSIEDEEDRLAEERLAEFILSPEEARQSFDAEARSRLGISGDEFLRKYDAGEIVDDDTDWRITTMVAMLPMVRHVEP